MKFIIEPINDTDCRITDIDCTGLQGEAIRELIIPATVEQDGKTYQVTEVGPRVCFTWKGDDNFAKFVSLKHLKKIIFSEGIEVIDRVMDPHDSDTVESRGNAEYLTEVLLPSTLKKIGNRSFYNNRALSKINIPDGVEEIGIEAFMDCNSLTIFPWPKSLKKVNLSAFKGLTIPQDYVLEIPDTIESIEGSLYKITFADCKISNKAWNAFDVSDLPCNVRSINIPEGVKRIAGRYKSIESITLPSTLEEIDDSAFMNSNALDCINELPASLKSIGKQAFADASRLDELKEIRIPSAKVKVGSDAFNNRRNGRILLTGDEATMKSLMGQPGALNGTLVKTIEIPEGTTEVEISDCPDLVNLTIPSTVTHIREIADCPKIGSLVIPDSVIEIDKISNLESISTIKLSNNLHKLLELSDCLALKELDLPDTLTTISEPDSYFNKFKNLKADIKASVKVWNLICSTPSALECYAPESGEVSPPEGVEKLAHLLFWDAEFRSIRIPASVKEIERSAFSSCSNLVKVEFAESSQLKKIGIEVFTYNDALESVTFPASITDYVVDLDLWGLSSTFKNCKNLKYVVFLADDPATAVYPAALGKMCDWYVPDHMVGHVKAFIAKAKADYPNVKGIGAKSVKPLSKLTGGKSEPKKKVSKRKKTFTKPIRMHSNDLALVYRFPIAEEDMHLLDDEVDLAGLAVRYLRDKVSECSFEMISYEDPNVDLILDTSVNGATENTWRATMKSIANIDFTDAASLPEDFPTALAPELVEAGSFRKLFASRCSNFEKKLAEDAPAYLTVELAVDIVFDFMIGEKEKFNVKKIAVMDDWKVDNPTTRCWRFGFFYNGRFIPATSIVGENNNTFSIYCKASEDPEGDEEMEIPEVNFDRSRIYVRTYSAPSLPFVNEILSFVKLK